MIISAGAINKPKILMLSGIGDRRELSKHGIRTKVNLPGVGKDLQEHPEATIMFEFDPKKYLTRQQAIILSTFPPGAVPVPDPVSRLK